MWCVAGVSFSGVVWGSMWEGGMWRGRTNAENNELSVRRVIIVLSIIVGVTVVS